MEIAKYNLDSMPLTIDISDDFILYTTQLSLDYRPPLVLGSVCLFRWVNGIPIKLPEVSRAAHLRLIY